MKARSFFGLAGAAGLLMSLASSCSSDDNDDGAGASGGVAGRGGAAGNAGSAGRAGSAGSAGAAGAGGAAGSAGAAGAAGAGGAAGSAGAAGAGGANGQVGSSSFAADVLPILQAECGDCHGVFIPFASDDEDEAYEVVTAISTYGVTDQPRYAVIVLRLEEGSMPPYCGGGTPGSPGCVSEEDFETIREWAESGDPPAP